MILLKPDELPDDFDVSCRELDLMFELTRG